MVTFPKGRSGNPKERPLAARGLRAALLARYGEDGLMLVERLEALSKLAGCQNAEIALDATDLPLCGQNGRPVQRLDHTEGDAGRCPVDYRSLESPCGSTTGRKDGISTAPSKKWSRS